MLRASTNLEVDTTNHDQELGVKIVLDAVKDPIRQMAMNAGESPDLILAAAEKEEGSLGIDFTTGEVIDMLEEGIIDPVKVTRCALQNAAIGCFYVNHYKPCHYRSLVTN